MIKKGNLIFALAFLAVPAIAQQNNYKTYEGVVLGEKAPRSAVTGITDQATQDLGDIYRGTVFGAEQKKYEGKQLGMDQPRATKKYVYDTSLIRAIKLNDADRVRTLMYIHVNVDEKNYAGITPLTVAAEKGNMEIIQLLVEDGKALVNEPSSYGVTPLIAASAAGNSQVIDYLVSKGADPIMQDDLGKTALTYAVTFDIPKSINALIKKDARPMFLPDNAGNTPLIYAAQKGYLTNVRLLLANGAKADYRNPTSGISAVDVAAAEGHVNILRALAKNDKNAIEFPDIAGRTPIFYAVEQNQPEALRALISLGANINAQDNNGVTPLMHAAAKNREECLAILLRQNNINVNLADSQGRTALTYSAYAEDAQAAKKLIAAGANIDQRDIAYNTPVMNAVKAKNDRVALLFIQQGADLTAVNNAGDNVFTLTEILLPQSATAKVLGVKRAAAYQEAVKIENKKRAEVLSLEEELAQQEAALEQLKTIEANRLKEEQQAKEQAVRSQLEAEYQTRAAALDNDPDIVALQQQLEAAKAQKEAALQQEMNQRLNKEMGVATTQAETTVNQVKTTATKASNQAKQTATKAKQTTNNAKAKAAQRQKAAQQRKSTATSTVKKATVAPQEINMADYLK